MSYHDRFKKDFPESFFCCAADSCVSRCGLESQSKVLALVDEIVRLTNETSEIKGDMRGYRKGSAMASAAWKRGMEKATGR